MHAKFLFCLLNFFFFFFTFSLRSRGWIVKSLIPDQLTKPVNWCSFRSTDRPHAFLFFVFNFSQSSTQCISSKCSCSKQNFHRHPNHVVGSSLWSKEWSYSKLQCHLQDDESKHHSSETDSSSDATYESNWAKSEHKLQHHSNGLYYQGTCTS